MNCNYFLIMISIYCFAVLEVSLLLLKANILSKLTLNHGYFEWYCVGLIMLFDSFIQSPPVIVNTLMQENPVHYNESSLYRIY